MDRILAMQTFIRVVEAGSFVRAAEQSGLSTTAASRLIADLETHLKARLLNRTTRKLSLTEAGQIYYAQVQSILADLDEAESAVTGVAGELGGLLRITAPLSFGLRHLAPILARFRARHPAIELDVALSDRSVDLVEEGVDLAIRITRQLEDNLVARRLAAVRIVTCAAPDYLQRRGFPQQPIDLTHHDCLIYTQASRRDGWVFNSPDGEVCVAVRGPLRANNGDLLRAAALAGEGIVREPTFQIGDDLRAGRLIPVLQAYEVAPMALYAVYPTRRHLSAKVRALVDFLATELFDPPGGDAWMQAGHPGQGER